MNKKVNTVLFMIGATIFNIVLMLTLLVVLLVLLGLVISYVPESMRIVLYTLVFFGALIGSYVIYQAILKAVVKKFGLEQYLSPLFRSRKR